MRDEQRDTTSSPEQHSAQHPMPPHFPKPPRVLGTATARNKRSATQTGAANGLSVPFVLGTMRQWWKVAAPLGILLSALAATAMWWSFEPVYEAQAWLRIEDRRPYIAYPTRDESQRFVGTQVELIRSPLVIGPAVSKPEVARIPAVAGQVDPIGWVGKNIKVHSVGNSELFVVSFANPDPTAAATVVNEVVGAYLDLRGSDDTAKLQRTIDLLDEERTRRTAEVRTMQNKLREMTIRVTGKDPFAVKAETQFVRDPMTDLQTQLSNAEVERTIAETQVQVLEESIASSQIEVPEGVIEQAVDEHPEVVETKAAIKSKIAQLGEYEMKLVGGKENPFHVRLTEQLREDEKRLEQIRDKLRLSIRIEMQTTFAKRQDTDLTALKARVGDYKILEQVLKQRCDAAVSGRSQVSGETLDLEFARAELARAEAVHDQISQRLVTLRTEQRAPERVERLRTATTPTAPVELLPFKKIGVLCLALFCLPFGLAVAWELVVRRVSDADRLEQDTQLPVIGEIARLPLRRPVLR